MCYDLNRKIADSIVGLCYRLNLFMVEEIYLEKYINFNSGIEDGVRRAMKKLRQRFRSLIASMSVVFGRLIATCQLLGFGCSGIDVQVVPDW